jgi:amino acid adenylation domain-containing protein
MKARFLHELVTEQADRMASATAIVDGGERTTYGALDERSSRLARALAEAGCRPGDRVALFLPKSAGAITAMLAASKAGCLYVPIDITSPAARVARITASSEPKVILACGASAKLFAELRAVGAIGSAKLGYLERTRSAPSAAAPEIARQRTFDLDDVARCPATLPEAADAPAAAHVLFTSGSTGQPKGVVITHASVLAFIRWAKGYFCTSARDRVSGHSPLHFDLSTFDVFGAFASGSELYLVPPEANVLPHKLADFIRSSELTQWFSVPSALAFMAKFDAIAEGDFPMLDRILWCGDVLPTPVLAHLMRRLPHVSFTNLYGPTEATIASSYHTVPGCPEDSKEPIPIGAACHGEELLVLDDAMRPAPEGEIGHLYIGGVGLSPGYFRDAERTREAFVSIARGSGAERFYRTGDLARVGTDGLLRFVGRADTQVKSRGYRIELGEIEAAANMVPELRECAAVALATDTFEGATLCLAYALAPGADMTSAGLRDALARLLPRYMLPARWMELAALPKNANGKIDRGVVKRRFEEEGS